MSHFTAFPVTEVQDKGVALRKTIGQIPTAAHEAFCFYFTHNFHFIYLKYVSFHYS
jgi:hypothetical protein